MKKQLQENMRPKLHRDGRTIGHPERGEETAADVAYWNDILRRIDRQSAETARRKAADPNYIDWWGGSVYEEAYAIPGWYVKDRKND